MKLPFNVTEMIIREYHKREKKYFINYSKKPKITEMIIRNQHKREYQIRKYHINHFIIDRTKLIQIIES